MWKFGIIYLLHIFLNGKTPQIFANDQWDFEKLHILCISYHCTLWHWPKQCTIKKKISINNIFLEKLRFTFFLREKWLVDFSIRRHRQTSPHTQQISSAEIFFFFKLEIKYTCLEHLYIFIFRLKTRHTFKKNLKALVWCASADLCLEFI